MLQTQTIEPRTLELLKKLQGKLLCHRSILSVALL